MQRATADCMHCRGGGGRPGCPGALPGRPPGHCRRAACAGRPSSPEPQCSSGTLPAAAASWLQPLAMPQHLLLPSPAEVPHFQPTLAASFCWLEGLHGGSLLKRVLARVLQHVVQCKEGMSAGAWQPAWRSQRAPLALCTPSASKACKASLTERRARACMSSLPSLRWLWSYSPRCRASGVCERIVLASLAFPYVLLHKPGSVVRAWTTSGCPCMLSHVRMRSKQASGCTHEESSGFCSLLQCS